MSSHTTINVTPQAARLYLLNLINEADNELLKELIDDALYHRFYNVRFTYDEDNDDHLLTF